MDFTLPDHLPGVLAEMDAFIEAEIKPLEREHMQYFDQRREYARTDWENGGIPARAWEDLLGEMRKRADKAGWLRYGLPSQFGGRDGTNLDMAVIREHLAHKGLGLHNDLQDESSIVGNFPQVIMMDRFGTDTQKAEWTEALITGERSMAFGLTEPKHGSDATWLETRAEPDGDGWVINGAKRFNTGVHRATHDLVFARTSGEPGQARGITAFLVPTDTEGFTVPYYWWTFNMPTDHGEVELKDARVSGDAVLGEVDRGLEVGQTFLHENRIRQAASSLGAAQYCIDRAVAYANERVVFGKPLAVNQAVQWPLVELQTEAQMVRLLVYVRGHPTRRQPPHGGFRQGLDGQLPRQPAGVRGRRPRHAGVRRCRLQPARTVRAHLPASPPLPHHRGRRGDPDPPGGPAPLRVRQALSDELAAALATVLQPVLGGKVTVENLHALTGGASRTTWAFDAIADQRLALILRTGPPDDVHAGMELEAAVQQRAAAAGAPVPHILAADNSPAALGNPYLICDAIGGETIVRRIQRALDDSSRERLLQQCAQALAAIHRADPDGLGLTDVDQLTEWRQRLDDMGDTTATFEWAFRWLDGHRPAPSPPRLVHGDFRMGNLIVDESGLAAVLDWELVHIGEVYEDLAWFCIRAWRFGAPEHLGAGGLGSVESFLSAYEAAAGEPVDRETFRWWLTLATLRWGVICRFQAERHLSGQTPSVELAAIGRRVSETEWDVLDLLEGGGPK